MKKFISAAFWNYAGERSLKTAIQTVIAGGLIGAPLFSLNPLEIVSVAAGAALASIATSVLIFKGDGSDNPDDTGVAA